MKSLKRPHVLWVNQFAVAPTAGGGTRHFEIGRELVKLGWDVTIAASDFNLQSRTYAKSRAGSRAPIVEQVDGVQFCWLWADPYSRNDWRRARNWLSFANSLQSFSTRLSKLQIPAPDVVIGSSPQLFAARAAFKVSRARNVPFILEVRDLWPESLIAAGGRKGASYAVFNAIARDLYRKSDAVVVLARGSKDYLIREKGLQEERVVCIPNGVDPDAFFAAAAVQRKTTTFVYAGAHGPANGLSLVLDAAQLLADRPDIRILLVGSGPEKAMLQKAALDRNLSAVQFVEPVSKNEIPQLFASVDAGLMLLRPSELFSFGVSPNKLFDYMAAGLPVVCNVAGEVADIVSESGCGLCVTPGNARSLADGMRKLADMDARERNRHGLSGRAWVMQENTRTVLAARLDSLLKSVVKERTQAA